MTPHIERREWIWVAGFAVIVIALTTWPYVQAWSRNSDESVFGGFLFGVEDGNSYLGKMRSGARGELDFSLFYTPEAHDAEALIFLPYILPGWVVGRLVAPTDPMLTPILMGVFHLLRVVFGVGLIAAIYAFAAAFLQEIEQRRLALVISCAGGGLGWLLALTGNGDWFGSAPAEFYIPEGFSALILLGIPHLALGRLTLLGGLLALMTAIQQKRWLPWAAVAAACWCVTGLAVPFYLPIVYCIVGAWGLAALIRDRHFPTPLFVRALTACGLTLPLFAYYAFVFARNPAFSVWSAQNILISPHPLHYLSAYGIFVVLTVIAARDVWQRTDLRYRLLLGWVVIVPILVYLPINVQRRMSEAVIVPLAILAAIALGKIKVNLRFPFIVALSASTAVLLAFVSTSAMTRTDAPVFRDADEIAAFAWLSANAQPDAIILSSVLTGNALPAYTDLRTFMGHGPETLYWPEKTDQLERFYRGEMTNDEVRDLLRAPCAPNFACAGSVRYVFYGPTEQALGGSDEAPDGFAALSLQIVYEQDRYRIYEVTSP